MAVAAEAANDLTKVDLEYRAKAARLAEAAAHIPAPGREPSPTDPAAFLRRYFWQAPVEDVLNRTPAELAATALAHYRLCLLYTSDAADE